MPAAASSRPVVERSLVPALRARLLGGGLVVVAAAVVLVSLLAWLLSLPQVVVTVAVVVAVATLGGLLWLLGGRRWVLRLDDDGYRVRALRSAQARSARWSDVLDVQTTLTDGTRCLVLRLRDGRTTVLPVDVLSGGTEDLTSEITARLDRIRGYRRLS